MQNHGVPCGSTWDGVQKNVQVYGYFITLTYTVPTRVDRNFIK